MIVDWITTLVIAASIAYACWSILEMVVLARESRNAPPGPISGPESLHGRMAVVARPFEPLGTECETIGFVRVHGETWRARLVGAPSRLPAVGDEVRIVGRDGLTVHVEMAFVG